MHKNDTPSTYVPENGKPEIVEKTALGFAFYENKLIFKDKNGCVVIPTLEELDNQSIKYNISHYIGTLSGKQCYGIELLSENISNFEIKPLRSILLELEQDMFLMAGRAFQIVNWSIMHRYCGKCGTKTNLEEKERVIACPSCKASFYPRISPAIIVAIMKGDKILLAHNNNFNNNLYSLVAGFVEPGETFEACVKREVMEEVGINIKNIRYYGSQPWPFPDSLMIGFLAEYENGEIKVDGVEIGDAGWYSRNNMPEIPLSHSIAGKIIKAYMENTL